MVEVSPQSANVNCCTKDALGFYMYIPDHFAIKDTDEAYRIIEAHPLGILVTSIDEGLDANHLPFELDAERGVLTAHVARSNRGVVARLTRTHEATEPKPWRMGDSSTEYIDEMLKAIVGIEIQIARLEGKAKLSQNREARDRLNAAEKLISKGSTELGKAMLKGA
jgi:predicted FMN-binding regulatory protein PaiB